MIDFRKIALAVTILPLLMSAFAPNGNRGPRPNILEEAAL
jgi:hypothetical protein